MLDEIDDVETNLALSILSYALAVLPPRPAQGVIDSRLGDDVMGTGLNTG